MLTQHTAKFGEAVGSNVRNCFQHQLSLTCEYLILLILTISSRRIILHAMYHSLKERNGAFEVPMLRVNMGDFKVVHFVVNVSNTSFGRVCK